MCPDWIWICGTHPIILHDVSCHTFFSMTTRASELLDASSSSWAGASAEGQLTKRPRHEEEEQENAYEEQENEYEEAHIASEDEEAEAHIASEDEDEVSSECSAFLAPLTFAVLANDMPLIRQLLTAFPSCVEDRDEVRRVGECLHLRAIKNPALYCRLAELRCTPPWKTGRTAPSCLR